MKAKATTKMTKMGKGGKATAKPKMKAGGTKKYAMAGTTSKIGDPLDGGKGKCKMGKCAPGTKPSMTVGQKIKGFFGGNKVKKRRV